MCSGGAELDIKRRLAAVLTRLRSSNRWVIVHSKYFVTHFFKIPSMIRARRMPTTSDILTTLVLLLYFPRRTGPLNSSKSVRRLLIKFVKRKQQREIVLERCYGVAKCLVRLIVLSDVQTQIRFMICGRVKVALKDLDSDRIASQRHAQTCGSSARVARLAEDES